MYAYSSDNSVIYYYADDKSILVAGRRMAK